MTLWLHELRLLVRSRLTVAALALLTLLTIAALAAGMSEVGRQRAAIAAMPAAQAPDIAAIADWVDETQDPGSAAYYSFHPTWDTPGPLAFAALGMRDVSPYILRIRGSPPTSCGSGRSVWRPRSMTAILSIPNSHCRVGSTSASFWSSSRPCSSSPCSMI